MHSIIQKCLDIAPKYVLLTCTSSDHQYIPFTTKTYSAESIISFVIKKAKNIDLIHRTMPIGEHFYPMIGLKIGPF